jgi:two-component system CheB/CheR fusion protein
VPFHSHDGVRSLDIIVAPLEGPSGLVISFLDASRYQDLRAELENSRYELKTAYEELQSTVEELETTNNELRERSAEVTELNQFLGSILGSFQSAVVVLGTEMEIRAWNRQAEDLWGLRSEEVLNQHFLNLDIGFPVEKLRGPIRSLLAGRTEHGQVTSAAVNRRGRPITCTVSLSQLAGAGTTRGVILVMDAAAREPAT